MFPKNKTVKTRTQEVSMNNKFYIFIIRSNTINIFMIQTEQKWMYRNIISVAPKELAKIAICHLHSIAESILWLESIN